MNNSGTSSGFFGQPAQNQNAPTTTNSTFGQTTQAGSRFSFGSASQPVAIVSPLTSGNPLGSTGGMFKQDNSLQNPASGGFNLNPANTLTSPTSGFNFGQTNPATSSSGLTFGLNTGISAGGLGQTNSSGISFAQPSESISAFNQNQNTGIIAPNTNSGLFGQAQTTINANAAAPNTGMFGQANPTISSAGMFGQTNPLTSSAGMFGQSAPSSTGGLFGQSTPSSTTGLFGQSAPTSTSGLFGQSAPSSTPSGLFGQSAPAATTSGLFGQSAPATTSGLFGQSAPSSTASGIFGQSTQSSTASGLFGQSAPASTTSGLFGQSAPAATTSGLFGQSAPAATTSGLFGQSATASTASGLFGQSAPASTAGLFVQSAPSTTAGLFGQSAAPSSTAGLFSQSAPPSPAGLFGQSSAPSSTAGLFGQSVPSSSSALFGQTAQPSTSTLFGQNASPITSTLFGQTAPPTTSTLFAQSAPSSTSGLFGQSAPTSSTGLFGQSTTATTPGLFSQPSNLSLQPTTGISTGGMFSQTSNTSSSGLNFGLSNTTSASIGLGGSVPTSISLSTSGGLGGFQTNTMDSGAGNNLSKGDGKSAKEAPLPQDIFSTIGVFESYKDIEKKCSEDNVRQTATLFHKLVEDTKKLRQHIVKLSNQNNQLHGSAQKLKSSVIQEAENVEMARRTQDTPMNLQGDNKTPEQFFLRLVRSFEERMTFCRNRIEEVEKCAQNNGTVNEITSEDMKEVLKREHETVKMLAAKIYTLHNQLINYTHHSLNPEMQPDILFKPVSIEQPVGISNKNSSILRPALGEGGSGLLNFQNGQQRAKAVSLGAAPPTIPLTQTSISNLIGQPNQTDFFTGSSNSSAFGSSSPFNFNNGNTSAFGYGNNNNNSKLAFGTGVNTSLSTTPTLFENASNQQNLSGGGLFGSPGANNTSLFGSVKSFKK